MAFNTSIAETSGSRTALRPLHDLYCGCSKSGRDAQHLDEVTPLLRGAEEADGLAEEGLSAHCRNGGIQLALRHHGTRQDLACSTATMSSFF